MLWILLLLDLCNLFFRSELQAFARGFVGMCFFCKVARGKRSCQFVWNLHSHSCGIPAHLVYNIRSENGHIYLYFLYVDTISDHQFFPCTTSVGFKHLMSQSIVPKSKWFRTCLCLCVCVTCLLFYRHDRSGLVLLQVLCSNLPTVSCCFHGHYVCNRL